MEVFSLLKYWKGPKADVAATAAPTTSSAASTPTIGDDKDAGPFFDLEFTGEEKAPRTLERETETVIYKEEQNDVLGKSERAGKLKFRLPVGSNEDEELELNSGRFPTATKLRIFMLRLKRSNSESMATLKNLQTQNQDQRNNNIINNKKKLSLISLLARAKTNSIAVAGKQGGGDEAEKRNKKRAEKRVVMGVSKRSETAAENGKMNANVKKKSKSAMVHSVMPNSNIASSTRRDDSLLQQEDGIQSAILHCKRSFNASRG